MRVKVYVHLKSKHPCSQGCQHPERFSLTCLRVSHVLLTSRGIVCSCETPVCVQEERRGPLGFSLPHPWAYGHWGQQEAGTDAETVCSDSTPVVVGQEMHPKQICFFMGF